MGAKNQKEFFFIDLTSIQNTRIWIVIMKQQLYHSYSCKNAVGLTTWNFLRVSEIKIISHFSLWSVHSRLMLYAAAESNCMGIKLKNETIFLAYMMVLRIYAMGEILPI